MEHQSTSEITIPTTLPEPLLSQLEHRLTHLITSIYQEEQENVHISQLAQGLVEISTAAQAIGDLALQHLQTQPTKRLEDYLITFDWSERMKRFLLLWRDILFQEHKSILMVSDGDATLEQFRKQKLASRDLLFNASQDVKNYLEATKKASPNHKSLMDTWYLQTNPWPTYKNQFEVFGQQAIDLQLQFDALWNSSGAYVVIKSHFMDIFKSYLTKLNDAKVQVAYLIELLKDSSDTDKINLLQELEKLAKNVSIHPGQNTFNSTLREQINQLPGNMKINVDIDGGKLLYKALNVKHNTNEWIESEVMSEIYEFYQIGDNIQSRLNLAIENIKNLIQSERLEEQPFPKDNILQILQNLNRNLDKSGERIIELRQETEKQLARSLGVSSVFNDDFLTLSFQSTINQYRRYQVQWWEGLKRWIQEKGLFIQEYRQAVRDEEVMSISEKVVRAVRQRTLQPEDSHYNNIFMTNGYIGDSFFVGREKEMAHIKQQVSNWKIGYRGALLLSGKRFAGKTLLGQVVNQELFNNEAISLRPENRIIVQGRPHTSTYNLSETLNFIFKYAPENKLIWIDDIELWQSDKITLSENVRALCNAIDIYSGKLFFMVSMSNWMREELQKWFDISKIFQSELNVDKMSIDDIQKAVLIRHSATHIQLVDNEGHIFQPADLQKLITQLYRQAEGNIGEVMHRWAALMHKYNDEKVSPQTNSFFDLPDFVNPDIAILLRTIMMDRQTNEYRLRKNLGPAFKTTYQPILQRGLNLGMIVRNMNGWLELNPMVVNETGRLLDKHEFLDFDGIKGY